MEHASSTLENIVGSSLRRSPLEQSSLAAWPMACGHKVAERTRALGFAAGVLRVQVPDAGWGAELKRLAPQYLAVLNRYVGGGVQRIEFVMPISGEGSVPSGACHEGH